MKRIKLKDAFYVLRGNIIFWLVSAVTGLIISPLMSIAESVLPRTSKIPDLLADWLYAVWELDTLHGIPLRYPQSKKSK